MNQPDSFHNTNQSPPVALVTGATGVIGPTLVRRLLAEGYRVRVLLRRTPPPGVVPEDVAPENVERLQGDITDSAALDEATQGADVVFHLAAKLHATGTGAELRDEQRRVNVEGTRNLVRAASAAGVQRLVHFSTINVHGPSRPPEVLDEDSPIRCDSWYAETKLQSEEIVLAESGAVVLRLAAVYGPRMKHNYPRLVRALDRRRFMHVGSGENRRTLVYEEDVAAAAVLAAEHPRATGRVYNVTDGRVHTMNEIVSTICKALGRRPPRLHLPVPLLWTCAAVAEYTVGMFTPRFPLNRQLVAKLVEDVAVSADRIQKELGYRPQYDLLRGWRATLEQRPT